MILALCLPEVLSFLILFLFSLRNPNCSSHSTIKSIKIKFIPVFDSCENFQNRQAREGKKSGKKEENIIKRNY